VSDTTLYRHLGRSWSRGNGAGGAPRPFIIEMVDSEISFRSADTLGTGPLALLSRSWRATALGRCWQATRSAASSMARVESFEKFFRKFRPS